MIRHNHETAVNGGSHSCEFKIKSEYLDLEENFSARGNEANNTRLQVEFAFVSHQKSEKMRVE